MKKTVFGFLIFCAVFALMFAVDLAISKLYTVDLVSVAPLPITADGVTPVILDVSLTRGGKPIGGHDIYALSLDGGLFAAYRQRTSADGKVQFTYYPYRVSSITPLHDVRFQFINESNSIFLEVGASGEFLVPVVESQADPESYATNSDIWKE
jgi:hypothetical protein